MNQEKADLVAKHLTDLVRLVTNDQAACEILSFDGKFVIYNVSVPQDRKGLVIGKNGETIRAIRTIIGNLGSRHSLRTNIVVQ